MSNNNSIYHKLKQLSWLLAVPLIIGVFMTSCGDTPVDSQTDFTDSSQVNNDINFVPDQFDAVGTIQGTVIDKATGEALSDVAVSLNFMPEGAEEPSVITDTTGSEGTYSFTGVPVNTDYSSDGSGSERDNSPYTLKVTTENLDNYRDLYRVNTMLTFEATGGDGAATNLVSDVTIPLSEHAVTLTGKAHTSGDAILSGVRVELYQNFNPIINGDASTQTDMLVDSAETGEDGSFEFTGVEEKANVWLRFKDDSDPANVVNMDYTNINETPAADGTTPEVDLGVINVGSSNQSGAFYLTDVTPVPESDVQTDTVFKFTFNRPLADNEYNRTDLGFGNGTIIDDIQFDYRGQKKAPGDVEFSASFSSDMKTLTVDPDEGTLADATQYELEMWRAFQNDNFVDEYGNSLSWTASDFDQNAVTLLYFTTNDNNQAPHTPTLAVDSTSLNPNWAFGSMDFSWSVNDDPAEVKEYEIYISKNGGPFTHMQTVNSDNAQWGEIAYRMDATNNPTFEFTNSNNATRMLTDETTDPIDEAISYELKVRAVSTNLQEGEFSNTITFEDVVNPEVYAVERGTGGDDDKLYVGYNEPMIKSLAENPDNYTVVDGSGNEVSTNITDISYDFENISGPSQNHSVVITFENASSLDSGAELVVDTDVTDLAGNELDSANNSDTY